VRKMVVFHLMALAGTLLAVYSPTLAVQVYTEHFCLVTPADASLDQLKDTVEAKLSEVCGFWGTTPDELFSQAQTDLQALIPKSVKPPAWLTEPGPPRITVVFTESPSCNAVLGGCTRMLLIAAAGHLATAFSPPRHQPFPGDLGVEIQLRPEAPEAELLRQLGSAFIRLFLGVDAQIPRVWEEGFSEYTAWALDPARTGWPYRAYGKLSAAELGEGGLTELLVHGEQTCNPELAATVVAFAIERWGKETLLSFLREATPHPLLSYSPDLTSVTQEAFGLAPAELAAAWHEWLSQAEISEAAEVWYFYRRNELAERLWFLQPLLSPSEVATAWELIADLPARGTWADLKRLYEIMDHVQADQAVIEQLTPYWNKLHYLADARRVWNEFQRARNRFRSAKERGDYQRCLEAYLEALEQVFGPLPPLEQRTEEPTVTFPDNPFQRYTEHLCIVAPPYVRAASLESWTEAQFKKVCELWGYSPDKLLSEAQAHLRKLLSGVTMVPDWLSAPVPPRITVVYSPEESNEVCGQGTSCTRRTICFLGPEVLQAYPLHLGHDPFPGDLGIEVLVFPGVDLGTLFHELGHAVLQLIVGIENNVPLFLNEGFAEYGAWQLNPDQRALPYRAYAQLAAQDYGQDEIRAALLGRDLYDPILSAPLIAYLIERWDVDTLLELLKAVATYPDPGQAYLDVLGVTADWLLQSWLDWLSQAEVTEAAQVWWFSQKEKLRRRFVFLHPLLGDVRTEWSFGVLNRLPSEGTWQDIERLYSLLQDPVREVVDEHLVSKLLELFPSLQNKAGAQAVKVLGLLFQFKRAQEKRDYEGCVEIYLQAVEAAFGPLPPLPGG